MTKPRPVRRAATPPMEAGTVYQFQVTEIVGAGRWGVVCVVRDVGRPNAKRVVLKVLREELRRNRASMQRLRDEARILARLRHPNLVRVHRLLDLGDRPVVVMEWVDGPNIDELLALHPGGLAPDVALRIGRDVAAGLDYAWNAVVADTPMHVMHRDLKPANVVLSVDGDVKIVDFGLAKGAFTDREARTEASLVVLGSRTYAAPELYDGEGGATVDVYSLGVMLYNLMTGRPMKLPLQPAEHAAALDRHLAALTLDPSVRDLLARMCAHQPDGRPPMGEVVATLQAVVGAPGPVSDLAAFARLEIAPVRERRAVLSPHDHPSWSQVAFLEGAPVRVEEADVDLRPPDTSTPVPQREEAAPVSLWSKLRGMLGG